MKVIHLSQKNLQEISVQGGRVDIIQIYKQNITGGLLNISKSLLTKPDLLNFSNGSCFYVLGDFYKVRKICFTF